MDALEAIILGLVQGLTEFLPVSSSGHIELAKAMMGLDLGENGLAMSVFLHFATALSIIVVFRRQLWDIVYGLFQFRWNEQTK